MIGDDLRAAAAEVFNLADALQDLLFYAKVEDLPTATRTVLTKEYRTLRAVCVHYDIGQTLEFNPVPGVPFTKKLNQRH
jgi:hypothetical protein